MGWRRKKGKEEEEADWKGEEKREGKTKRDNSLEALDLTNP